MITKFNQFINEGLTDLMTSKSKEEVLNAIIKNANVKYGVKEEQLENFKNCVKYLLDNNYEFDHKDDFKVLWFNWKGNDSIYIYMNGYTKFEDLKKSVEFNKERYNLTESIRDQMTGKTKEELEIAAEKVVNKLKNILPGFSLTMKDIKNIIYEDDLNLALMDLQDMIGQEHGDVAGVYFSGLEDPEEEWEEGSPEQRLYWIKGYLDLEASYQELNDEDIDHEKQDELDNSLAEANQEKYYVYYTYDFATHKSKHHIRIFDEYTDEKGIHGDMIFEIEDTQMMKAIKESKKYLTKEQLNTLIEMMRMRSNCIVLPDGKIGK